MLWCDMRPLLLGLLILIDHVKSDICGSEFTDIQSNAILAPVIFEGRVTGKSDINSNRYNASVKVLKIHKGKQYLMEGSKKIRRVTLGEFGPEDKPQCISEIDMNVKKYIFFVERTLSEKYYKLTALPVKQGKKSSRSVRKIICNKCAKIPKIKTIKDQKKREGQKVKIRCSAKAKPRAVYSWYKDDVLLKNRKGLNIKQGKRASRLQIKQIKKSDEGRYKCIARNAAGKEEAFFSVEVTAKKVSHPVCATQTYCFNGGTCHFMPELNNQTFCRCPVEWAGTRCETYDHIQLTRETSRQAKLLYDRTLIIIGIVIAVLVFILICVVSYFMSRRARKKWEKRRLMKSKKNIPDSSIPLLDDVDSSALANRRKTSPPQTRPSVHKNTQTGSSLAQIFPTIENHPGNNLTETPTVETKVEIPLNHFMPSNRNRGARGSRSRLKAVSVDDPTVGEEKPIKNPPPTRSRSDPNPPWKTDSKPRQDSIDELELEDLDRSESMQDGPVDSEGYAPLDEIDYPAEPHRENIVSPYPVTGTPESDPGPPYPDDPGVIDVHNMNEFPDEVPSPITDDPATNPLLPFDSSDSEEEHSPLPVLYISEEDIRTSVDDLQSLEVDSGNVNDTLSEHDLSPHRDDKPVSNGNDSDMASRASNSSATSSSAASVRSPSYIMYNSYQDPKVSNRGWDEQGTPVSDHFAYNSIPDSDSHIIDDQFMHKPSVSPSKHSDNRYSNVNNKKLKDICDDQDAIPI